MRTILLILVMAFLATSFAVCASADLNAIDQETPQVQSAGAKSHTQSYLYRLFSPENLPNIGLLFAGIVGIIVAIRTLNHMQESSERQLRAYVVCDSGFIFNVTNPVPLFPGQVFAPTPAQVSNPATGPGAQIQIKNTGQTPAFKVRHWGNICFREYPLAAGLPARLPNILPHPCVLGAGIPSTKLLELNPALTPQQVADLRAGTGAVYIYGEITYVDAFGCERLTKYRLMHHRMGGAIGVSTDLTFTDEGNEAD